MVVIFFNDLWVGGSDCLRMCRNGKKCIAVGVLDEQRSLDFAVGLKRKIFEGRRRVNNGLLVCSSDIRCSNFEDLNELFRRPNEEKFLCKMI